MAEARAVFPDKKILQTSIGKIEYDYLVFAAGTTTNFYGNANIEKWAIPMKTVSEAMGLRNAVLSNLERALTCATEEGATGTPERGHCGRWCHRCRDCRSPLK